MTSVRVLGFVVASASLLALPASASASASEAPFRCGTVERLAPEARGGVPCFFELPNRVESEHFSVEWGNAGNLSEATAQFVLDELERTRQTFIDGGYAEPLGNPDGYKVPFYLGNSGSGAPGISFNGGYTTVCNGFAHAYVVMSGYEQSNGTLDTANHELFHAVQMGSPSPWDVNQFYWESSATWAEEFAEPDFDIYQWFLPAYTNHTNWALDYEDSSQDGFLHRYALFILPIYIEEHAPAGPEVLRAVWNGSGTGIVERMELAWRDAAVDTSFEEQFGHFTARVSTMDFEDGPNYDFARVPARAVLVPPAERLEQVAPRWYGAHFYRVDASDKDVDAGRTKLRVRLDGYEHGWVLAVNRSPDGREAIPTVVEADDETGVATIEVIDVGSLYEEVWVTVTSTQTEHVDYDLSVELVDQTEAPGSDLLPPDDGDDDDDRRPGAGCAGPLKTHPFSHGALSMSLLLLLLPLRRRTS